MENGKKENKSMNIVARFINWQADFYKDVAEAKVKKDTAVTNQMKALIDNKFSLIEKKESIRNLNISVKYQRKLEKKTAVYIIASLIGTLISIYLTISNLTKTLDLAEMFLNADYAAYVYGTIFCQITVWYIAFDSLHIKQKHNSIYKVLSVYQIAVLSMSVINNYKTAYNISGVYSLDNIVFSAVFAISVDIASIYLAELAQNEKYKNYVTKEIIDESNYGLFNMIYTLTVKRFKLKLIKKYNRLCDDYNKAIEQEKQKQFNKSDYEPIKPKTVQKQKQSCKTENSSKTVLENSSKTEQKHLSERKCLAIENKSSKIDEGIYRSLEEVIKQLETGKQISGSDFEMKSTLWRYYRAELVKQGLCKTVGKKTVVA